jgi:hypothetical protein
VLHSRRQNAVKSICNEVLRRLHIFQAAFDLKKVACDTSHDFNVQIFSFPSFHSNVLPLIYLSVCLGVYLSIYQSVYLWLYSSLLGLGLFQFIDLFYSVGRTPWTGDQSIARPLAAHRTAHKHKINTQTSMTWVGFEPTTPGLEWAKANVIGSNLCHGCYFTNKFQSARWGRCAHGRNMTNPNIRNVH